MAGNRKKVWFSLLVNAVSLAILLLIFAPYYETNDDMAIQSFVNFSRGVQDGWTRTCNYLFGFILCVLYRITQQLPWYTLVLYGTLFVSLSVVTFILLNFKDGWLGGMIAAVLLITYGYQGYIMLNFTRIAGAAGGAGALLIVVSARRKKADLWGILIGTLAVFAGYIIRPQEAVAAAACASAAGIYALFMLKQDAEPGKRGRRFLRYILCLLPVFLLMAGAKKVDEYELKKDPVRQAYYEYGSERIAIMDHGFPPYAKNAEEFEELGINYNAWYLYSHWDFYDPEKMSTEVMSQIRAMQPENHFSLKTVTSFLKKFPETGLRNPMCWVYLMVVVLVLFYGKKGWKSILTVLYDFLVINALMLYMFYQRRYGLPRVDVALWLSGALGLLPLLEDSRVKISGRTALLLVMFVLIFSQKDWSIHYRAEAGGERAKQINFRNYTSMLSNDTSHLYVVQTVRFFPDQASAPFDLVPVGSKSNIASLGGWTAMSSPFLAVYERYHVTNPYRDMIGSDVIRLVTDDPTVIEQYLRDYYDPDCYMELVGSIGKNNIYKVVK